MRWVLTLLLLATVGAGAACWPLSVPAPAIAPAPAGSPEIRLWQDAAIFDSVAGMLQRARGRVWLEMYEFERDDLAAKLEAARAAGLDVRAVLDPSVPGSRKMAGRLRSAGVPVRLYPLDDRRHQIDHVKLLITADAALVTGMNWGRHSAGNHDYGLEVRAPPILARLAAIFEQDWSLAGGLPAPLTEATGPVAQTAPGQEIRGRLALAIAGARRTVLAEVFVLTDPETIAALAAAHRRGVDVRLLLDPNQEVNRHGFELLRRAGVGVRWYPVRAGAKLHAKAGLFDSRLLLGSANWSVSGLSVNHELDLETDDGAVAAAFKARFDADWGSAA
jgi:phosphatidylserine/phosphatidylglycerophosphate/cardiolipin synthase-like enzyme